MIEHLTDWALLLGRWVHITTAVCWIGTSIFFMWMDRSFEKNHSNDREGHVGDLWMVHGGGFYKVEKMLMGPTKVPEVLHWFKWEAYWTWMSGMFLLIMMFYIDGGTHLVDEDLLDISGLQAMGIGLGSIFGSWIFYDQLWESKLAKKAGLAHTITILYAAGMIYVLCHTILHRIAFIHIAAVLGTWMVGNVLLRIIPRMKKMVEYSKNGQPINPDWAINAKNRSTHNTYFTLPIIFIMFTNHFPNIYAHDYNWILLIMMTAAGAAIRHYFVIRVKQKTKAQVFAAIGVLLVLATIAISYLEA